MNQNLFAKIKSTFAENKIFGTLIVAALVMSAYAVCKKAANNYDYANQSRIDVEGECLKKISKDRYKTEVTIKFNDSKSSAVALQKSKELYTELLAFAEPLKAEDKSMEWQTTRIEVAEDKQWSSKTDTFIHRGYNATLALEISTENPETLDKIISFAATKKDMLLSGIENYVSPQKMKRETEDCLAEAITNAKSKARSITDASGDRIGKLLSAYIKSNPGPSPRTALSGISGAFYSAKNMAVEKAMDTGMIQSADYDLNVRINAAFEIK